MTGDAVSRPLLRLVARAGSLTDARAAAVRARLAPRPRGGARVYSAWPDLTAPLQIVPLDRPEIATWASRTFEPWSHRPGLTAYLWSLLRARGALTVREPGPLVPFAESLLRRPSGSMDALFVSMTGGRASKLLCFVFDPGAGHPAAVAKVIPDRRYGEGLRREVRVLEEVRERRLPEEVASALPAAPLAAATVEGDFVVVEPIDRLAHATRTDDRAAALGWLERFHRATTTTTRPWGEADTDQLVARAGYAWGRARPERRGAVVAELSRLSDELHGTPVARSAVHGDFWGGNIAYCRGSLRIFDWEWGEVEATPFVDVWAYELAPLVERSWNGSAELAEALARASRRVETAVAARNLPQRFAALTLAPMLADLGFRFRRERGIPGGSEERFARMLPAVERVMGLSHAD